MRIVIKKLQVLPNYLLIKPCDPKLLNSNTYHSTSYSPIFSTNNS